MSEAHSELQVRQRDVEGIRLLDLHGRLTIGVSESSLRSAVADCVKAKLLRIVLNVTEISEIDEDGLAAMVFCYARTLSSGGALKLLSLTGLHTDLMVLTKMDSVFEIFSNEADAINSFFPDRAVRHYDILNFVEEQEKRPPDNKSE